MSPDVVVVKEPATTVVITETVPTVTVSAPGPQGPAGEQVAHTHAESDVTGLAADLATKEPKTTAHHARHDAGGADALVIDAAAGTGSLRTLGSGATQAAAGAALAAETTARVAADALLIPLTQKGVTSGVATLDGAGTIPDTQIPAAIARDAETTAAVASEATARAAADSAHAASGTAHSGTYIAVDAQLRNVKDHGALGDGSHDDTSAIQTTINLGGITFFPPGQYRVSQLTMAAGTFLLGSGSGSIGTNQPDDSHRTHLARIAGSNQHMILGATGADHVRIRDIMLDGNSNNNTVGDLIHLDDATDEEAQWHIDHCFLVATPGYGIYVGLNRRACKVTNCIVSQAQLSAIYLGASDGMILETLIGSCTLDGIEVAASTNHILGCDIFKCRNGINLHAGVNSSQITNTDIDTCNQHGLAVGASVNSVSIVNGNFTNNSQSGDNTYDHINIAANCQRISVVGTNFSQSGSISVFPRYAIFADTGSYVEAIANNYYPGITRSGMINDASRVATPLAFSVKSFGAIGDGAVDDTTAIQNCLNAGGVTYIPPGTFITGKLTVPNGANIMGVGSGGPLVAASAQRTSILKLKNGTNDDLLYAAAGVAHVRIRDVQLDGNKTNNTSSRAVNADVASPGEDAQWDIRNVFVLNTAQQGILIGAGRRMVTISDTVVNGCSGVALRMNGTNGVVSRCKLLNGAGSGGNGIEFGAGGCGITDSIIAANNIGVVAVSGVDQILVRGNIVSLSRQHGIQVASSAQATIVGNLIKSSSQTTDNTYHNIDVVSTTGLTVISGNTFGIDGGLTNLPDYDIYIEAGASVRASANVEISGASRSGLTNDFTKLFLAEAITPSGLTGATAASRYVGATASGAPASGTFAIGDFVVDQAGKIWICTVAGTPGTWKAPALVEASTVPPATNTSGSVLGTSATAAHSDHTHIVGAHASLHLPGGSDAVSTTEWALGLSATRIETFSRLFATGSPTLTANIVFYSYFQALRTLTISNLISANRGTAATAATLARMGLCTVDGSGNLTLVAACASDTALWTATQTQYSRALSTGGGLPATYQLVQGTQYAFAMLCVTGGTAPTPMGISLAATISGAVFAPTLARFSTATQTDLPTSITSANLSNANTPYWGAMT